MKIAVIGTGHVGGRLAARWAEAGHEVVVGVRDLAHPEVKALEVRLRGRLTAADVARSMGSAEVVVLAVPFEAALALVRERRTELAGKVVIDCTNPLGVKLEAPSGAEAIAAEVPSARLVKAFNTQGAEVISNPTYGDSRAACFYAGDDRAAKDTVRHLIADLGFEPVDAGTLASSKHLESLTLIWFAASKALGTRDLGFHLVRRGGA
jgi:8-hydroxy-5-deazaflavin:NADPH oxidoreductase